MRRSRGHPAGRHLLAAHRPDAVEQAGGRRHGHQRRRLRAAARLAEDGHVTRIAAEARDVVAHPAQREDQVQHPDVAGVGELRPAKRREVQITERVQPVIDGDDHHVAAAGEPRAVGLDAVAGVARERAGVEPDQHRPPRAVGERAASTRSGEDSLRPAPSPGRWAAARSDRSSSASRTSAHGAGGTGGRNRRPAVSAP